MHSARSTLPAQTHAKTKILNRWEPQTSLHDELCFVLTCDNPLQNANADDTIMPMHDHAQILSLPWPSD
jgi:hypothetical protein